MLIADAVGLGKTIQAGLILGELAAEHESFRALVIAPAGLREQWAGELARRFGISTTIANSPWLARTVARLPADVNPWSLPGIYLASFDFIKRPEVLRPFEEVYWTPSSWTRRRATVAPRVSGVHAIALVAAVFCEWTPTAANETLGAVQHRDPASIPTALIFNARWMSGEPPGAPHRLHPVQLRKPSAMHRLL